MGDSTLSKISDFYDTCIDNKFCRLLLLIGAGGFGLLFGKLADVQFFRDYLGLHETVAEYLATAVVGIFVFILLWYFRTRDVRQQIETYQRQIGIGRQQIRTSQRQIEIAQKQVRESQMQIWQNQFNDAIGNLTTESVTKEEIGAQSLIKLSETTSEFNELIIIAFKSRIEELENYTHLHIHAKYLYRRRIVNDMKNWLSDPPKPEE